MPNTIPVRHGGSVAHVADNDAAAKLMRSFNRDGQQAQPGHPQCDSVLRSIVDEAASKVLSFLIDTFPLYDRA